MYTGIAMKLDGAIFDLDGTLGDTLPVCFAAFRRALRGYSQRDYTDDEIVALFGPSEEGIIRRILPEAWPACLTAYLAAYEEESARNARVFPGIETALRLLKRRGLALGIATGKGARSAAISMRDLRLADYFDVVETGSPEGGVKPQAIRKILRQWGAVPQQVVYVGDAPADMEAAREAGVIPLGAAWAAGVSAEELQARSPLETFRSVAGFIAWVEMHVEPRRP